MRAGAPDISEVFWSPFGDRDQGPVEIKSNLKKYYIFSIGDVLQYTQWLLDDRWAW